MSCSYGTITSAKKYTIPEILSKISATTTGSTTRRDIKELDQFEKSKKTTKVGGQSIDKEIKNKSVPGVQIDLDRFIVQGLSSAPITLKAKMVYYLTSGNLRNLSLSELATKITEFWRSYI